jgi:hypothetical protein
MYAKIGNLEGKSFGGLHSNGVIFMNFYLKDCMKSLQFW